MCDGCCSSGDAFGGVFGGATAPYNTPYNTLGVGDLVPAGIDRLGNDFRQMGKKPSKRGRRQITGIQEKRPSMQPFINPGRNTGFDMSPRPLIVPHKPKK